MPYQVMERTSKANNWILVVEDDSAILFLIAEVLRGQGYQVVTATDGLEGMRICDETPPSLIILDMWMPIIDGWHFVAGLKARGHAIPFLLLSAGRDIRRWAHQLGAVGFIEKPFDMAQMLEMVERLLPSNTIAA